MKRLQPCSSLLLFFWLLMANHAFTQQNWTFASAKRWVDSREWANGSNLKLSPATNVVEFAKQFHKNKAYWIKALAFLNDKKLDTLKPGRYQIAGDTVFAIISDAPTKALDETTWESHRNYIDLHYVIKGEEKIGVAPVSSGVVTKPYDQTKDIANYNADGTYYEAAPDEFFLFFPTDAHRPGIKSGTVDRDEKLVIKIMYNAE